MVGAWAPQVPPGLWTQVTSSNPPVVWLSTASSPDFCKLETKILQRRLRVMT